MKNEPSRGDSIPVRLVEGKCEFLFGGVVPVKEGAVAELVVKRLSIGAPFLEKLDRKETHKILAEKLLCW